MSHFVITFWSHFVIIVVFVILGNFKYRTFLLYQFKGAAKSYFVLFNTALCVSAFSTVSFGKLVFRLSVLSEFFVLD